MKSELFYENCVVSLPNSSIIFASDENKNSVYSRKHSNFFPFLILILLFIMPADAHPQSGVEILKKIQNKFKSINNFKADFVQTISDAEGKQSGKLSGKFFYKTKNKFVVELKNGTIISDGETVWNYNARQKRVVISSFSDDPTSFSLERYLFDYPALCKIKNVSGEKSKDQIIELVPKDNNIEFKSAKIWKSPDDLISRMEIIDLGDTKYVFQLNDIKVNQDFPESKFAFNPTKGIKIIDLR